MAKQRTATVKAKPAAVKFLQKTLHAFDVGGNPIRTLTALDGCIVDLAEVVYADAKNMALRNGLVLEASNKGGFSAIADALAKLPADQA